jgi:polyferredoxin
MKKITIYRRVSQAVFFGVTGVWLAVGALRCPFGIPFVSCQSCPSTDCPGRYLQLPFIGLAGLSGLLFGRAFCGWACPFGFVMDVAGKARRPKLRFSERFAAWDRYLKLLKWPAVGATAYLVLALNYPEARAFPYVIRTSSVFNVEAIELAQALGDPAHLVRMLMVVGAVVTGLAISRAWCRYLCPVGAVLGLFNKFSLFGIRNECEECGQCEMLPEDCIMQTRPQTTDCVVCGECVEGCPRDNLALRPRFAGAEAASDDVAEAPRVDRDAS